MRLSFLFVCCLYMLAVLAIALTSLLDFFPAQRVEVLIVVDWRDENAGKFLAGEQLIILLQLFLSLSSPTSLLSCPLLIYF